MSRKEASPKYGVTGDDEDFEMRDGADVDQDFRDLLVADPDLGPESGVKRPRLVTSMDRMFDGLLREQASQKGRGVAAAPNTGSRQTGGSGAPGIPLREANLDVLFPSYAAAPAPARAAALAPARAADPAAVVRELQRTAAEGRLQAATESHTSQGARAAVHGQRALVAAPAVFNNASLREELLIRIGAQRMKAGFFVENESPVANKLPLFPGVDPSRFILLLSNDGEGASIGFDNPPPDDCNNLSSVVGMTDRSLERHMIAWLLPTDEPARHAPEAPLLTQSDVHAIQLYAPLMYRCYELVRTILAHVGIVFDFEQGAYEIMEGRSFVFRKRLGTQDHNRLRMTRVLRFMKLVFPYYGEQLLNFLASNIRNEANPEGVLDVTEVTFEYWCDAVRRAPRLDA
jgi:hypothetical protein